MNRLGGGLVGSVSGSLFRSNRSGSGDSSVIDGSRSNLTRSGSGDLSAVGRSRSNLARSGSGDNSVINGSRSGKARSGLGDLSAVGGGSRSGLNGFSGTSGVGGSFSGIGSLGSEFIISIEEIVIGKESIVVVINKVLVIVFDKVLVIIQSVLVESGLHLGLSGGIDRSSEDGLGISSFVFEEVRSGEGSSGDFSVVSVGEMRKGHRHGLNDGSSDGLDGSGGVGGIGSGESEGKIVILEFRGGSSKTGNGKESDGFLHFVFVKEEMILFKE